MGNLTEAKENIKEIRIFIQGQVPARRLSEQCDTIFSFEMRNDLFGDEFSEGFHFKLEFRLDFQQPHKLLAVNKCIQLF